MERAGWTGRLSVRSELIGAGLSRRASLGPWEIADDLEDGALGVLQHGHAAYGGNVEGAGADDGAQALGLLHRRIAGSHVT